MTTIKITLAMVLMLVASMSAQTTKPSTTQLKPEATALPTSVFMTTPDGTMKFVKLGPTLKLTCAASCSLDTVASPAPPIPSRVVEKLVVSSVKMSDFTLANAPTVGELDVQRNGIELTEGFDYDVTTTLNVVKVIFRPGAEPLQGDAMRFKYR